MDKLIDKMGAVGFSLLVSALVWLVAFNLVEPLIKALFDLVSFGLNGFVWCVGYVTYFIIGVGA